MYASRMSNLPPYLFARIDEMKAEQQKKGVDIIDLGVGDPDPSHTAAYRYIALRSGQEPGKPPLPFLRRDACLPERRCGLV